MYLNQDSKKMFFGLAGRLSYKEYSYSFYDIQTIFKLSTPVGWLHVKKELHSVNLSASFFLLNRPKFAPPKRKGVSESRSLVLEKPIMPSHFQGGDLLVENHRHSHGCLGENHGPENNIHRTWGVASQPSIDCQYGVENGEGFLSSAVNYWEVWRVRKRGGDVSPDQICQRWQGKPGDFNPFDFMGFQ